MTLEIIGQLEKEQEEAVRSAFRGVLAYVGQKDSVYVELTLASPQEIQEVNKETRGIDRVTDILSFPTLLSEKRAVKADEYPQDVDPESGEIMLGELLLCMDRAKEQAEEYGHSLKREVAFLVTHGLLHLYGYDHVEKEDEEEMFPLQEKILQDLGITR